MKKIETPAELVKAVKLYFELADQIHEFFGYKEDWVTIPMREHLNEYWMLIGGDLKGMGGIVVYSEKPFSREAIIAGKVIYSDSVYTQRFLPKWLYRTTTHTLISVDTHTDGNRFLSIFDNDNECKDQELKNAYTQKWG